MVGGPAQRLDGASMRWYIAPEMFECFGFWWENAAIEGSGTRHLSALGRTCGGSGSTRVLLPHRGETVGQNIEAYRRPGTTQRTG